MDMLDRLTTLASRLKSQMRRHNGATFDRLLDRYMQTANLIRKYANDLLVVNESSYEEALAGLSEAIEIGEDWEKKISKMATILMGIEQALKKVEEAADG